MSIRANAAFAALGIVALCSGCPHGGQPRIPDDPEPKDVEWDPGTRARAEKAFAATVVDYEKVAAKGKWTPSTCDDMAGRFEALYAEFGGPMHVALFNAGAVREACGQTPKAKAIYQRLVSDHPKSDLGHNQLGVLAARAGHEAEALKHFRAAIEANPTTRAPRNNLAAALRKRYANTPEDASFRQAENQLQNVLAVDSDNRPAFENLARLYYDRGRLEDKAYLMLADLVVSQGLMVADRIEEPSADLHVIRGLILMQRGDDVRALRAFEKAAEIDPDHGDAHMNIAMIALRFRDFDNAEKSLSIAKKDDRHVDNIETYLGLGVAYRGLRKYDDAKRSFEQAQTLAPKDPRPLYNLGILYQEHIAPSKEGFDEKLHRKAIGFFEDFTKRAAGDRKFSTDLRVGEPQLADSRPSPQVEFAQCVYGQFSRLLVTCRTGRARSFTLGCGRQVAIQIEPIDLQIERQRRRGEPRNSHSSCQAAVIDNDIQVLDSRRICIDLPATRPPRAAQHCFVSRVDRHIQLRQQLARCKLIHRQLARERRLASRERAAAR